MEKIPPECSCVGPCFRKWDNPIAAIEKSCNSISGNLQLINSTTKCIAESKKKIEDPKSTPEEISKAQYCLRSFYRYQAIFIVNVYHPVKTFEECPYCSYFIQTTDYGRRYLLLKEEQSDLINKIMAISSEDISSIMNDPLFHIEF